MSKLPFKTVANYIEDILKINLSRSQLLKPLVFSYYVTDGCNFNCAYCNYAQKGLTRNFKDQLNTRDSIKLLELIKEACPNLYMTGGEPLTRLDISEILRAGKQMNFESISMVTNMSLMHKNMDVLDYINNLTVSLDMLDEKEYARIIRRSPEVVKRVKENIIACSKLQKEKKFDMRVNFVITKQTLPFALDVLNFCSQYRIGFTFGPEIKDDGSSDKGLIRSKEYRGLMDKIMEEKRKGRSVFMSFRYLEALKDFKPFRCYPLLTPRVDPLGNFWYPCRQLENKPINLLEVGSYKKAIEKAIEKFGPPPHHCKEKCYMNCYIETSNLVRHPFSTLIDLV